MKFLKLSQGYWAMVDDEDYDRLSQWKWHARPTNYGNGMCAARIIFNSTGKISKRLLHHEVLEFSAGGGLVVDHRDGNTLNCRRGNLRICTHSQNVANRRPQSTKRGSKYKGVIYCPPRSKGGKGAWEATIQYEHKRRYLGRFADEHTAVKAYNVWARRLHGQFAYLNKWDGPTEKKEGKKENSRTIE
jgi:hypothetical protein